ncbi:cullin-9-like [Huso huso]|uniref:Cullin-9-like n=1 Tax=Huso huso TaxID=61971 RepID=A0ABR0ZYL4_HUSHU
MNHGIDCPVLFTILEYRCWTHVTVYVLAKLAEPRRIAIVGGTRETRRYNKARNSLTTAVSPSEGVIREKAITGCAVKMVGERRNGNLLVQLGPNLQAYPEELIRQRRTHDGQTEYLIRWSVLAMDEGGGTGSGGVEGTGESGGGSSSSSDNKSENILMWMTREDVYANCPTLLGNRKNDAQRAVKEEQPSSEFPSDVTFDEAELSDMKEDVKQLVRRAHRQMARSNEVDIAVSISHTIHVLSAYASIGSLVGVFKETGALDLLMELLCNKERQTRRSAGKMLRALASHDAGRLAQSVCSIG